MNKPNFDIVLICKNESKTLPRLIESLKEFKERGGVINLLDTGSTDGTADIARSLGCNVEEVGEKFIITIDKETADNINGKFIVNGEGDIVKEGDRMFDYSGARNYAATMTDADWVWQPDCDEVFTKFDIDGIEEAISDPEVDLLEYEFIFAHDKEGNALTKFRHSKMYKKSVYQWFGVIHEVLGIIHEI